MVENRVKAQSPIIGHAVAIGDKRSYLTALIVLDEEGVHRLRGQERPRGLVRRAHARTRSVRAEVERAVEAANATLARVEQVKKYTVLDVGWLPGLRRGHADDEDQAARDQRQVRQRDRSAVRVTAGAQPRTSARSCAVLAVGRAGLLADAVAGGAGASRPSSTRSATSADTASWAVTAFLLSSAVATPIAGRLGDMFGKRRVLVAVLLIVSRRHAAVHDRVAARAARRADRPGRQRRRAAAGVRDRPRRAEPGAHRGAGSR